MSLMKITYITLKYLIKYNILVSPMITHAFTYHRPMPEDIKIMDVTQIKDVFNTALAVQIHATLFKMNFTNTPEQYLVEHFDVSKDALIYKFILKNITFHDEVKLNSEIVAKNFEYFLKKKLMVMSNYLIF